MRKLLSILIFSLLLSGNAYANNPEDLLEKKVGEINISYKCIRSEAETEVYMGEKSIKKLHLK